MTAGYAVLNLSSQFMFAGKGNIHSLSLNLDNIFNTEYRSHLSRIKSILPEAGRSLRVTYKLYFNL
jgi:iron complex outermembrane receptor protein